MDEERSSKGKGTRTTECLIIKRLSIIHAINILFLLIKKIKGRTFLYSTKPDTLFIRFGILHNQDQYPDILICLAKGIIDLQKTFLSVLEIISMAFITSIFTG